MSHVFFLFLLLLSNCQCEIFFKNKGENIQFETCLINILRNNLPKDIDITYVDLNSEDNSVLKVINSQSRFSVINRNAKVRFTSMAITNMVYIVSVRNATDFLKYFKILLRERTWNPYAKFLVILKIFEDELRKVFDELLKHHVDNVVVVNRTSNAHLYTYNPFDNYGCGKRYDKVISYGKCLESPTNLYPEKHVTGLRNCTFNVLANHWPPYAMDPSQDVKQTLGIDEYALYIISELEGFQVNFSYHYPKEQFYTITDDMKATGAYSKLQNNETDLYIGGLLLEISRASAFTYITGHLPITDELKIVVKRASLIPAWKNIYREFEPEVWIILLATFFVYCIIMHIFLQKRDNSYIMFQLLDNLLLHGFIIRCTFKVKCLFMIWIWFSYLINSFYQSNLVSIMTNPSREYQIQTEEDLIKYNVKPCLGKGLITFIYTTRNQTVHDNSNDCPSFRVGLKVISESDDWYTLITHSILLYNRKLALDELGEPTVYAFESPYIKVIYVLYMYKGFPLYEKLKMRALSLRETGLMDKKVRDLFFSMNINLFYKRRPYTSRYTVPWSILAVGYVLAGVTLILEIVSKKV